MFLIKLSKRKCVFGCKSAAERACPYFKCIPTLWLHNTFQQKDSDQPYIIGSLAYPEDVAHEFLEYLTSSEGSSIFAMALVPTPTMASNLSTHLEFRPRSGGRPTLRNAWFRHSRTTVGVRQRLSHRKSATCCCFPHNSNSPTFLCMFSLKQQTLGLMMLR